jgi:hypothetical protein
VTCVLAGPHMANGGISVKQNMSLSPPSSELPVETDALESWTGAVRADERAAVGQPEPNPLGEQQNTLPGSPCAPVSMLPGPGLGTIAPTESGQMKDEAMKRIKMKRFRWEHIVQEEAEAAKFETNEEFARHEQSS